MLSGEIALKITIIIIIKGGKALAWDDTCTESFSTSHLSSIISNSGTALKRGRGLEETKIFSTCGRLRVCASGCRNIWDHRFSRMLAFKCYRPPHFEGTNDPLQMSYIFQQISVAIIRGNTLAVTASSRRYAQEFVERHWHSKWRCIILFYY